MEKFTALKELIETAEKASTLTQTPEIKLLRHYPGACRIKVAVDFRIVAHFNGTNKFTFISILHRRHVYRELYFLR